MAEVNRGDTERPQDTVLQKYSLELLSVIDEMRRKRDMLHKQVLNDMKEKEKLQSDLKVLTNKLAKVNETICDKAVARNRLDETIRETEQAFSGLVVGSENLLKFMKKMTVDILPEIAQLEEKAKEDKRDGKKNKTNKKCEPSKR